MKNWGKIAEINDKKLRALLVSAGGEIAERLMLGFPEYFLGKTEKQSALSKVQLLKLSEVADRRIDVYRIVTELKLSYRWFVFNGYCRGQVSGVSYHDETYQTSQHDSLCYYYRSSAERGTELEHEEKKWLILWNSYRNGVPEKPSRHSLIMVSLNTFLEPNVCGK